MVVLGQHLPLVLANSVGEIVGVERWHRRHREDVAGGDIQHDDRSRLVADPARRKLVEVRIDGQLDGAATAVRLGLELFDQFAARGDLDTLTARLAAERRFQRLLKPFFANLHSRDQQQRVLVFLFIFGCGGGADIADQLADRGAARVIARESLRGRNARQVGQAHGDRGVLLVGDIVGDRHRLEAARGGKLARDPLDLVGGQAHELGQLGNDLRRLTICWGIRSTRSLPG